MPRLETIMLSIKPTREIRKDSTTRGHAIDIVLRIIVCALGISPIDLNLPISLFGSNNFEYNSKINITPLKINTQENYTIDFVQNQVYKAITKYL